MIGRYVEKSVLEFRLNFADFRRDRKQQIGLGLFVLGSFGLFGMVWLAKTVEPLLVEAVAKAALTVVSFALVWSGVCGMWWRKLTSRQMRQYDMAWTLASLLSVGLVLTKALLLPADEHRKNYHSFVDRSRLSAEFSIEQVGSAHCAEPRSFSKDVCDNLGFIYDWLRHGYPIEKFYVLKICPPPPLKGPEYMANSSLYSVCLSLYPVAYPSNDPLLLDEENVREWGISSLLFTLLISLAIGVRVAKSVSELWWMADVKKEKPELEQSGSGI